MSSIPTPRSYQQILSELIDTFMARLGLKGLKIGGPALSILEAAAASDTKATQDIFGLLDADSVDRATKEALDRIAQSENLTRLGANSAGGRVAFGDTSFTKVTTVLDPNSPSPAIGTTTLVVADGSVIPAITAGNLNKIYLGRGTVNYEGPFVVVGKLGNTITILTPITKYHAPGETVTLGQGGDRTIPSGTIVTTSNKYSGGVIQFATQQSVTIPDGEISSTEVECICSAVGTVGNVGAGAISTFATGPFVGATVTNSLPITNGRNVETDEELRARIKLNKQSRTKGTVSALKLAVLGASDNSEHKTIVSSSFVPGIGTTPNTLYVDDGNGYVETVAGVPLERLTVSALGGEQIFQLVGGNPVVKAFIETNLTEPYNLPDGATLAVMVGQAFSEHTFDPSEFVNISQAKADEIVASINANPNILFSARLSDNRSRVVVFAKEESGNDIEIAVPAGTDANDYMAFTTGINYDLLLYKNDVLLYEDGTLAKLYSAPNTEWGSMATGLSIDYIIDGLVTSVTINDADFINAGTPYTSVASAGNDLDAWALVLNDKLYGITVSVELDRLVFVSDLGRNDNALVEITDSVGADFFDSGVFNNNIPTSATGKSSDFTFNKNTGQLKLNAPLALNDTLSAGSTNTRGFVETESHPTGLITLTDPATFWVSVDGGTIIPDISTLTASFSTAIAGNIVELNLSADPVGIVEPGDWVIINDTAINFHLYGRISRVQTNQIELIVDNVSNFVGQALTNTNEGGIVFVKTSTKVQQIRLAAGVNRTLQSIVDEINGQAQGFQASVFHQTTIRLTTNDYTSVGEFAFIAQDAESIPLGFTVKEIVPSVLPQVAEDSTPKVTNVPLLSLGTVTPVSVTDKTFVNEFTSYKSNAGFDVVDTGPTPILLPTSSTLNFKKPWVIKQGTSTDTTVRPSKDRFSSSVAVGGLVRAANVVTATTSTTHKFKAGDIVWLTSTLVDPNFSNIQVRIETVPAGNQFTYTNAGANAVSVQVFTVWLSESFGAANETTFSLIQNNTITPYDTLSVRVNNDPDSTFEIPMYRNVTLSGAYGTTLTVTDEDNSGNPLDVAFGTDYDFADHALFMKSRGLIDKPAGNGIYFRNARYGAEGDGIEVHYDTHPTPSTPLSIDTATNAAGVDRFVYNVRLPTDVPRAGIGLENGTWLTVTNPAANQYLYTYTTYVATAGGRGVDLLTVTITLPAPGLPSTVGVGDIVYLTSTDPAFPSGPKIIATKTSSVLFTYIEPGANVVAAVASLTFSGSSAVPALNNAVALDIVNIPAHTGTVGINTNGHYQVLATAATSFTIQTQNTSITVPSVIEVGDATNFLFYPLDSAMNTVGNVVAQINGNYTNYLSAVGVGLLTGNITKIWDYDTTYGCTLADGLNYIDSYDDVFDQITLKDTTIDTGLNYDQTNETMRIVPITPQALTNWLNSTAVTGLSNYVNAKLVDTDKSIQLSSTAPGDLQTIELTGGTANTHAALLVSASGFDTDVVRVRVGSDNVSGFMGDRQVLLTTNQLNFKTTDWTNLTKFAINAGGDTITISVAGTFRTQVGINQGAGTLTGDTVKVYKFGDYALYITEIADPISNTANNHGWIEFRAENADPANTGILRCIYGSTRYMWVYNPNAVEETFTFTANDKVIGWTYDSLMPGDTVVINSDVLGTANRGTWTVLDTTTGLTTTTLTVQGMTTVAATAIANVNNFKAKESQTGKWWGVLDKMFVDSTFADSHLVQIYHPGIDDFYAKLTPNNGYYLQALDKLEFDNYVHNGKDAYKYNTGLIGEAHRIIYGDQSSPIVYPGVIAAGTNVNIHAPLIRSIELTLDIRLKTGFTDAEVIPLIQNAVAARINATKMGDDVDLASVIAAARSVQGVTSVVAITPALTTSTDVISIQDNEKAMVLNMETDITVNILGN